MQMLNRTTELQDSFRLSGWVKFKDAYINFQNGFSFIPAEDGVWTLFLDQTEGIPFHDSEEAEAARWMLDSYCLDLVSAYRAHKEQEAKEGSDVKVWKTIERRAYDAGASLAKSVTTRSSTSLAVQRDSSWVTFGKEDCATAPIELNWVQAEVNWKASFESGWLSIRPQDAIPF